MIRYKTNKRPNVHQSPINGLFYVALWDETVDEYVRRFSDEERIAKKCLIEISNSLEDLTWSGTESQARQLARQVYGYSKKV